MSFLHLSDNPKVFPPLYQIRFELLSKLKPLYLSLGDLRDECRHNRLALVNSTCLLEKFGGKVTLSNLPLRSKLTRNIHFCVGKSTLFLGVYRTLDVL